MQHLHDGTILIFDGLDTVHGLVKMRIKRLSDWFDALSPNLCNAVQELLVYQLKTPSEALALALHLSRERVLEIVDHRNQSLNDTRGRSFGILAPLLFDALPIIVKVCLASQ
jgi:hypothetical protein